jgi:RNA polymerase sigma factor (sigma-70 family)
VLYDRHHAAVLSYCRHMLGSRDEAEDALQQAFVSAHADIVATDKPIRFKAWLFTIARNRCLSILRGRREQPSENLERISTAGLAEEVEYRADLKELVEDMQELPEDQRAALILSELGDLSHAEVAEVIDCEVAKVKSLVFQARSGLMERREARETPCEEIREQLSTLRGGSLRRGPLRRHLKACPGCTEFRNDVRRQRQALAAVLPVVPTLALKENALAAVGITATTAGGGALAGGGAGAVVAAKAGVAKVAVIAAATTATVGGAVAVEKSVVADSHRNAGTQSEARHNGTAGPGSDGAAEMRASDGANAFGSDQVTAGDPEQAAHGHAYGKGGVGAEHKNGFVPVQGESNGERASEFAAGRGQGNHTGTEERPVARGGSNPHAGPKPKKNTAQPQNTKANPGPQNDKPKPHAKPDLTPLLPTVPDLKPPSGERGQSIKGDKAEGVDKLRGGQTNTATQP